MTMYRWKASLFLLSAVAWAQQPPPLATAPSFHTGTQLVQVSVIAQDNQGKPVANLRREDFQIFDDGAAREIQLFVAERSNSLPTESRAPNAFTNRIAEEAGGGGAQGGYSVLLFDNNNTGFEPTARARLKALQALQSIPKGDKIAMYSLWCRFQVIREFTLDRESLKRQLESFAPAAGGCGSRISNDESAIANHPMPEPVKRLEFNPELEASRTRAEAESNRIASLITDSISDEEIKQMADHLAGIPGRKNLIWIAASFPLSPSALQRLINAGVAIYPVDAIGSTIAIASEKAAHSAPLRALAAMTGGVAFFDRDDLDTAIREALEDGHVSYTLGFYRPADDRKAMVHQLRVGVTQPNVALRYRTTYASEPPAPVSANPVADLVRAMNRPVDATAIPISASAIRTGDRVDLSLSFDVSSLGLDLNQGLWKGKAELVARFMTAEGVQAGDVYSQTVAFNLRPATYSAVLQSGVPFRKEMKIPASAVELKLLVANVASGRIGTLTIPLSGILGPAVSALKKK